jgi:putative membrane protein insertion efficiency factor
VTLPARIAVALIRAYKRWISPLLPPSCRFEPTCSVYAADAVRAHGTWRGLGLAARRLLRCRPGVPGGYDPVPPPGAGADGSAPPDGRSG